MKKTIRTIHITYGGPDRKIKDAAGKVWLFEMHTYFGPMVLKGSADPADRQPGPRSLFWPAVTLWAQQGGVIGDDGLCAWAPEPAPELVHLGGRNYALAGSALAEKYGHPAEPGCQHKRGDT